MKKIVISLCFTFILSTLSTFTYAQTEALAIKTYVDSAPTECLLTGIVDGSISAYSGTWWPAIPQNYTGLGYYHLHVPNCYATLGLAHASATTDSQIDPHGSTIWCFGGGFEDFNFYAGNDLDPIHLNLESKSDHAGEQPIE